MSSATEKSVITSALREAPAFGYPGRNQRDPPLLAISRGAGELASAAGGFRALITREIAYVARCSAPTAPSPAGAPRIAQGRPWASPARPGTPR